MHRRQTLRAAACVAMPGLLRAQTAKPSRLIGILGMFRSSDSNRPLPEGTSGTAFMQGLAEAGYRYGTDFTIFLRGIEGDPTRIAGAVQDMLQAPVAVIVAAGPFGPPLHRARVQVPVVMCGSEDPVGQGLVQSLASPGGMITGLSNQVSELGPKRLELLAELYPAPVRLGLLRQAGFASGAALPVAQLQEAARAMRRQFDVVQPKEGDDLSQVLRAARSRDIRGMLVTGFLDRRAWLDEEAARAGIGLMWPFRSTSKTEELISYSADFTAIWHRAAHYVDRILRGAHPGTLPMEQPTKIDLVINLRKASRLGLQVPQSLLLRAARVIE